MAGMGRRQGVVGSRWAGRSKVLGALALLVLVSAVVTPRLGAQTRGDLRAVHEATVFATVRIRTGLGMGSGWLLAQDGARPLVMTNRHVAETARRGAAEVDLYQGASLPPVTIAATVFFQSSSVDLAIFQLAEDPPAVSRPLEIERGDVSRGERVVLGGNPGGLPFQTTEGVVTGALPATTFTSNCGAGRNCLVVDAASFAGSSGGPAVNAAGRVVGMLWGGPLSELMVAGAAVPAFIQNPAFAYLVHIRTIEDELRAWVERARADRARRDAEPARPSR